MRESEENIHLFCPDSSCFGSARAPPELQANATWKRVTDLMMGERRNAVNTLSSVKSVTQRANNSDDIQTFSCSVWQDAVITVIINVFFFFVVVVLTCLLCL